MCCLFSLINRYFCVYAALTVTFSYLMIVTYFVAIMSYDVRRIKAGRRDCLPFCRAPPPKENEPAWDEPRPQVSNKLMNAWAKFLTHPATKVVVIIFSLASLAAGIYGATVIDENFDRRILAKDDSYLKKFLSAHEQYFKSTIPVSVVVTGDVDYGESSVQDDLRTWQTLSPLINITRTPICPGSIPFPNTLKLTRRTSRGRILHKS